MTKNSDGGSYTAVLSSTLIAAAMDAPGSQHEVLISGVKADGVPFQCLARVSSIVGVSPMLVAIITLCNKPVQHSPVEVTGRDLVVLRALARGHHTKKIAEDLSLSESSIKQIVQRLYEKFEVTNHTRSALILAAAERCPDLLV